MMDGPEGGPGPGGQQRERCQNCMKTFVNISSLNRHLQICQKPKRKTLKRKVKDLFQQFRIKTNENELRQLIEQVPCKFLRFSLASATGIYIENTYPGVFNINNGEPKRAKVENLCSILADASKGNHNVEGIQIPKYIGNILILFEVWFRLIIFSFSWS